MSDITIVSDQRPNYFKGQLLQAEDFLAEQNFHVDARRSHNLMLHDWGIVRGLDVRYKSDSSITIMPGVAVDKTGCEVSLEEAKDIDIGKYGPDKHLRFSFAYQEMSGSPDEPAGRNKRSFCSVIAISEVTETWEGVALATIHLDSRGKLVEEAIDRSEDKSGVRYARPVAPGSITLKELNQSVTKGWLRIAFRPDPLADPPEGEKEIPPAFRRGPTEARSPHIDPGETDKGAAGTMALPLQPNVRHVTRFRIAGTLNKGGLTVKLYKGGWDPLKKEHIHKEILVEEITSAPFDETYAIKDGDTEFDPECQTLSVWLRGMQKTSVSLVAVEMSCQ